MNDEPIVLANPTVADLITYLQTIPPETKLRITDADTDWTISIIHISRSDDTIWLYGEYHEMSSGEL